MIEGWRVFVAVDCRLAAFFGVGLGTVGCSIGDLKKAVGDGIVMVSMRMSARLNQAMLKGQHSQQCRQVVRLLLSS